MAVFRVEKTRDYTVMANHHLKDTGLSLKAKGLLSMMLSLPDEWNYTTRGLASICKEGVDSIGATLRELEKAGYIVRNQLRDAKGRITDTEYVIYEKPQRSPDTTSPDTAQPDTINPDTENPYLDNPDADKPCTETTAQLNTNRLKNDLPSTKKSNTHAENPYQSNPDRFYQSASGSRNAGFDGIGYDNPERLRKTIMENIDYDCIADKYNRERLDEIVELMLEILCRKSKNVRIGGEDFPSSVVKGRLLKLDQFHIEYVLDCMNSNTTQVRNIKQYMLAALFNAPITIDHYYQAAVNHDFYGKKE
jgi:hypothetical protein